ncbi:hypothetical protein DFJ74DRAFT_9521 [Hyaloraphidium curvatum]|nr:hypothetical protein DFJ74DRAFT_9521 [Hyaloraphidium curvatum]
MSPEAISTRFDARLLLLLRDARGLQLFSTSDAYSALRLPGSLESRLTSSDGLAGGAFFSLLHTPDPHAVWIIDYGGGMCGQTPALLHGAATFLAFDIGIDFALRAAGALAGDDPQQGNVTKRMDVSFRRPGSVPGIFAVRIEIPGLRGLLAGEKPRDVDVSASLMPLDDYISWKVEGKAEPKPVATARATFSRVDLAKLADRGPRL